MFREILSSETLTNDWRVEIADYLKNPSQKVTRKLSVGVLEPGVPQPTSEFVLRAPNPGW